jgi:hypothetical protein
MLSTSLWIQSAHNWLMSEHMKSRSEIKREVVQGGGTIDDAFKLIKLRTAAQKQIEELVANNDSADVLIDLLTIEQVEGLAADWLQGKED